MLEFYLAPDPDNFFWASSVTSRLLQSVVGSPKFIPLLNAQLSFTRRRRVFDRFVHFFWNFFLELDESHRLHSLSVSDDARDEKNDAGHNFLGTHLP